MSPPMTSPLAYHFHDNGCGDTVGNGGLKKVSGLRFPVSPPYSVVVFGGRQWRTSLSENVQVLVKDIAWIVCTLLNLYKSREIIQESDTNLIKYFLR